MSSHTGLQLQVAAWKIDATDKVQRIAELPNRRNFSDVEMERVVYDIMQKRAREMNAQQLYQLVVDVSRDREELLERLCWTVKLMRYPPHPQLPAEEELNEAINRIKQFWEEENKDGACQTALDFIKRCRG